MAFRFSKMNGFILGFHRLVWWPKWTPASRSSVINSVDIYRACFLEKGAKHVPTPKAAQGGFWESWTTGALGKERSVRSPAPMLDVYAYTGTALGRSIPSDSCADS